MRRGKNRDQSGSTIHPPSAPAVQHSSPPFYQLLKLYKSCVVEGRWARFTLETMDGEEEFSFNCSNRSAAATALSPATPTVCRHARKRPPNKRRREKERRRWEAWKENRQAALNPSAAAHLAAPFAAASQATVGAQDFACIMVECTITTGSVYPYLSM